MTNLISIHLLIPFTVSLVLSLLVTPWIIRLAGTIGAIDRPNERKVHTYPIPRLGGLGIALSFLFSLTIVLLLDDNILDSNRTFFFNAVLPALSLLIVLILGIWDDLSALGPGRKFLVQLIAATLAYAAGFRISFITSPSGPDPLYLGILEYPVTVLWIVGVSNAFNLIDGLDGLASGIAVIASLTIFSISFLTGDLVISKIALLLAGSVLGFLVYNFHPARIFLGDSGSLFIGFVLALLSMQSSTKGSTAFAILVPVLALGLPIMDTLVSMFRRFLFSLLPDQSTTASLGQRLRLMFMPDRKHIHHQLVALGLSHRNVVFVLYTVSCLFGVGAFAVTVSNNTIASLILLAVALATIAGIRQLRYKEMAILQNGILLPLYEWPVMNHTLFLGFLDLAFTVAAFCGAMALTSSLALVNGEQNNFLVLLALVCGVQLAVFLISGLYRQTIRLIGVGDLLNIVKTVSFAALAACVAFFTLQQDSMLSITTAIIDFYFLLTLVVGARISFHVLNYLFRRQANGDKKVLIYGANSDGVLALNQILNDNTLRLTPIGFLDDTPGLEGKKINGYPVYGGHWKLDRLARAMKVDQILLASEQLRPHIARRLQHTADRHGITLKRSKILLEELTFDVASHRQRALSELIESEFTTSEISVRH